MNPDVYSLLCKELFSILKSETDIHEKDVFKTRPCIGLKYKEFTAL